MVKRIGFTKTLNLADFCPRFIRPRFLQITLFCCSYSGWMVFGAVSIVAVIFDIIYGEVSGEFY